MEHLWAINAAAVWVVFHRRVTRYWQVWFHIAESRENNPAAKNNWNQIMLFAHIPHWDPSRSQQLHNRPLVTICWAGTREDIRCHKHSLLLSLWQKTESDHTQGKEVEETMVSPRAVNQRRDKLVASTPLVALAEGQRRWLSATDVSAFYYSNIVSDIDPKLKIDVDGTSHDRADQNGWII